MRGLSVRDVEAALVETFDGPVNGKSTVARVCHHTRERDRRWCDRQLDEHDLVYLFMDALYLKLRPDEERPRACRSRGASGWRARVLFGAGAGQPRRATRTGSPSAAT